MTRGYFAFYLFKYRKSYLVVQKFQNVGLFVGFCCTIRTGHAFTRYGAIKSHMLIEVVWPYNLYPYDLSPLSIRRNVANFSIGQVFTRHFSFLRALFKCMLFFQWGCASVHRLRRKRRREDVSKLLLTALLLFLIKTTSSFGNTRILSASA